MSFLVIILIHAFLPFFSSFDLVHFHFQYFCKMTGKRVAVVGAGASGLPAIR